MSVLTMFKIAKVVSVVSGSLFVGGIFLFGPAYSSEKDDTRIPDKIPKGMILLSFVSSTGEPVIDVDVINKDTGKMHCTGSKNWRVLEAKWTNLRFHLEDGKPDEFFTVPSNTNRIQVTLNER